MSAQAQARTWRDQGSPPLDVWAAVRAAVPDTDDHTARHRRGVVILPWQIDDEDGLRQGDEVEAWVCCDPACAGVELGESVLSLNHGCCDQRAGERGWHRVGLGRVGFTGAVHGPYTPYWQPSIVGAR